MSQAVGAAAFDFLTGGDRADLRRPVGGVDVRTRSSGFGVAHEADALAAELFGLALGREHVRRAGEALLRAAARVLGADGPEQRAFDRVHRVVEVVAVEAEAGFQP